MLGMGDFHVKKIILPSGKAVEIVYFHAEGEVAAELGEPARAPRGDRPGDASPGLETCPSCGCDMVFPTDWREAEHDRWELELCCPNCHWRERGSHEQDVVERYDAVLNEGTDRLIDTLETVTRENMEAEIDRFVEALEHGHIVPFDF